MNSRLMSFPLTVLALAVLASGAGGQCELDKLTASDAGRAVVLGRYAYRNTTACLGQGLGGHMET